MPGTFVQHKAFELSVLIYQTNCILTDVCYLILVFNRQNSLFHAKYNIKAKISDILIMYKLIHIFA